MYSRVHVEPDGYLNLLADLVRHLLKVCDLIKVVYVDHGTLLGGFLKGVYGLMGSVEDDVPALYSHLASLLVLKGGDHLSKGTLLMENCTNRLQVVGLVRPAEGYVGIPLGESPVEPPV